MYLFIYLTPYNSIKYRLVKHYFYQKKGDFNSYGWVLLSVYVLYKKQFISIEEYDKLCNFEFKKAQIKLKISQYIKKNILSILILILLFILILRSR